MNIEINRYVIKLKIKSEYSPVLFGKLAGRATFRLDAVSCMCDATFFDNKEIPKAILDGQTLYEGKVCYVQSAILHEEL